MPKKPPIKRIPKQGLKIEGVQYSKKTLEYFNDKSLYMATPCYGGMVGHNATMGYIATVGSLFTAGVHWQLQMLANESLISRARNQLAMHFLMSDCTHLMFIDADIGFTATPILQMLAKDKDLIGCVYPKKELNWQYIYKERNNVKDGAEMSQYSAAYASNFVLNKRGQPIEDDGLLKIQDLATGFMMIKREVFLKMMEKWPDRYYKPDYSTAAFKDPKAKHFVFFDTMIHPESRRYLSEDYYFCYHWKELGGEIWCYPNYDLSHMGMYNFKGALVKK
jgi:hypothetical protein